MAEKKRQAKAHLNKEQHTVRFYPEIVATLRDDRYFPGEPRRGWQTRLNLIMWDWVQRRKKRDAA